MYEPYEERRKFKINLEDVKRKLIERAKNFRQSKWFLVVIAIILIGGIGTYSGYVTYTAKLTEINSRITILERQLMACQENATSYLTNLQNVENELSSCQKSNQDCNDELEDTKSDLNTYKDKNEELTDQVQNLESSISECEAKYNELDQSIVVLQSEKDQMECNYAKKVCGNVGLDYYYLKGDMTIICCLGSEISSCTETSSDATIKEINC